MTLVDSYQVTPNILKKVYNFGYQFKINKIKSLVPLYLKCEKPTAIIDSNL